MITPSQFDYLGSFIYELQMQSCSIGRPVCERTLQLVTSKGGRADQTPLWPITVYLDVKLQLVLINYPVLTCCRSLEAFCSLYMLFATPRISSFLLKVSGGNTVNMKK